LGANKVLFKNDDYQGKPPLVWFPHPLGALPNAKGISPSAEGDQRCARWIGGRFLGKAAQKHSKTNHL